MKTKKLLNTHLFVTIFFISIISLPIIGSIFNLCPLSAEEFSKIEKRNPSPFPKSKTAHSNILLFLKQIEQYCKDHYTFRNIFIRSNNTFDVFVLGVSPDEKRVILGKRNWLFFGKGSSYFRQHTGLHKIDKSKIISFLDIEAKKKKFLNRRGIQYLIVIPPDKASIYPEYLPDYILNPNRELTLDSLLALAKEKKVDILDLKPALLEKKKYVGDILYRSRGTHWSMLGGYFGYERIMTSLENYLGPLQKFHMSSYRKKITKHMHDLSYFFNLFFKSPGHVVQMKYSRVFNQIAFTDFQNRTVPNDPMRLFSLYSQVIATNTKPLNDFSVLFLKDSFTAAMFRLFNSSFNKCVYGHYKDKYFNDNIVDLVLQNKPDIVLSIIVERELATISLPYPPLMTPDMTVNEISSLWDEFPDPILTLEAEKWKESCKVNINQASFDTVDSNELIIHAYGEDPYFVIPDFPKGHDDLLVSIDIVSPAETMIHLYYSTDKNSHFHWDRKYIQSLHKGKNKIYCELSSQDNISQIRLDPGMVEGDYILNDLTIKPLPKDLLPRLYGKSPIISD